MAGRRWSAVSVVYTKQPSLVTNGRPDELDAEQTMRAYQALIARDGKAERRAFHWQLVCALLLLSVVAVGVWDHLDRRTEVVPMVQPVQVTDDSRVMNVGLPVKVLDYQPQDAQWFDMLGKWIKWVRWHGGDEVIAKDNKINAYLYSCNHAIQFLEQAEKSEGLFKVSEKRTQIHFKSFNQTPSPKAYQVIWEEVTIENLMQPKRRTYTASFVVGRWAPKQQDDRFRNFLGLCVDSYDISLHPTSAAGGGL